jgi:hypothetical protein
MTTDYKAKAIEIVGLDAGRETARRANAIRNELLEMAAVEGMGALRTAIAGDASLEVLLEAARREVDAKREILARQMVADELAAIRTNSRMMRESITSSDLKPALAWLNTELGALMSRVRGLDKRAGASRPSMGEVAADPALAEVWAKLDEAVSDYVGIRAAQTHLLGVFAKVPRDVTDRSGHFRDALEVDAPARAMRLRESRRSSQVRDEEALLEWFAAVPRVPFSRGEDREAVDTDDPVGFLRWISRNAKPWVPTVGELLAVDDLVRRMLRGVVSVTGLQEAHQCAETYFDGLTPSTPLPPQPTNVRSARIAR